MKPWSYVVYFCCSFTLIFLLSRVGDSFRERLPSPPRFAAPQPLPPQPLQQPAAPAVPASASPLPADPTCSLPPPYRGVLDPSTLAATLRWAPSHPVGVRLSHAVSSASCPRYVFVDQNLGAGVGHRVRQWSHGLWVAASLPAAGVAGVAHAHTSLDEGVGAHGQYSGFDELLGLGLGEGALDIVGPGTGAHSTEPWLRDRGIATVPLPRYSEAPYAPNAPALAAWAARLAAAAPPPPGSAASAPAAAAECSVAYRLPMDHWAVDHASPTRALCAWKYAAAQVRAAALAAAHAAAHAAEPGSTHHRGLFPPAHWPPAALHIGVHFRVTDGKLLPCAALAAIVSGTLLPALRAGLLAAGPRAAATPILLHVYSESTEPRVEVAELLALQGAPGASSASPGLQVYHYGPQVSVLDTVWQLSQCDFFVGSVSSLSWAVAQFSSRPLPLLQEFALAGEYAWCLSHGLCCRGGGGCTASAEHPLALQSAVARLAAAAQCGQLGADSWLPPSMPEVEAAVQLELGAGKG